MWTTSYSIFQGAFAHVLPARVVGRHQALVDEGEHALLLQRPWRVQRARRWRPVWRSFTTRTVEEDEEVLLRLLLGAGEAQVQLAAALDHLAEHLVDRGTGSCPSSAAPAGRASLRKRDRKRAADGAFACSGASEKSRRRSRS